MFFRTYCWQFFAKVNIEVTRGHQKSNFAILKNVTFKENSSKIYVSDSKEGQIF